MEKGTHKLLGQLQLRRTQHRLFQLGDVSYLQGVADFGGAAVGVAGVERGRGAEAGDVVHLKKVVEVAALLGLRRTRRDTRAREGVGGRAGEASHPLRVRLRWRQGGSVRCARVDKRHRVIHWR